MLSKNTIGSVIYLDHNTVLWAKKYSNSSNIAMLQKKDLFIVFSIENSENIASDALTPVLVLTRYGFGWIDQ